MLSLEFTDTSYHYLLGSEMLLKLEDFQFAGPLVCHT